jgi:hypothetical protein
MVAKTINDVNLLAGVLSIKAVGCALEAEWLHRNYHKCNAQALQGRIYVPNICYL